MFSQTKQAFSFCTVSILFFPFLHLIFLTILTKFLDIYAKYIMLLGVIFLAMKTCTYTLASSPVILKM